MIKQDITLTLNKKKLPKVGKAATNASASASFSTVEGKIPHCFTNSVAINVTSSRRSGTLNSLSSLSK
jgi:hypothetical protein